MNGAFTGDMPIIGHVVLTFEMLVGLVLAGLFFAILALPLNHFHDERGEQHFRMNAGGCLFSIIVFFITWTAIMLVIIAAWQLTPG